MFAVAVMAFVVLLVLRDVTVMSVTGLGHIIDCVHLTLRESGAISANLQHRESCTPSIRLEGQAFSRGEARQLPRRVGLESFSGLGISNECDDRVDIGGTQALERRHVTEAPVMLR